MTFQEIEILKNTFLFKSMTDADILRHAEGAKTATFCDGDAIPDADISLGIILSGAVKVASKSAGTPLRTIPQGGIFGAASVFSDDGLTAVTAVGETKLCLFDGAAVSAIIKDDSRAALAYVKFLSDRVRYLNRKIEVFTAGSAAEKLAFWLSEATSDGSDSVTTHLSELAGALDLGRASLYRAIDTLSSLGIIAHEGRTLRILDREKLKDLA